MAQPPPRPAASRQGGPASGGASPASSSGPRSKESDKQQPGTFFLGRYRVVDEIGVGGMASVHLARMDGPGGFQKWVAIKRIHPHLVEDDQFVDMFLDEARIAAGINHANVAQVFDLGKDDNTYWIAMEYLHGEPLREVMRRAEERKLRVSPELAARIVSDAAEGLHAAHELRGKNGQLLGLVHRDVTPHNLFLTYDGYTKVVDFGIAKVADRLSSTRAGTLKGKLAYMSPEQVRGAEVDRTTDIFALGVVLWEITTSQRLFRMDTDLDTLEKVQACVVPPPSTIVPGYPPELEACVMKALSKRKQDRFPTAREFSRALQTFLVRSGHFVGPEEVALFIRTVFADRIQKREAHLAWAAEVTSTINVEKLRGDKASGAGEEQPLGDRDGKSQAGSASDTAPRPRPVPGSTPASGERERPRAPPPPPPTPAAIASQSLMDDDEDVPPPVALREQLEGLIRPVLGPAAGLPAPPRPAPQAAASAGSPAHPDGAAAPQTARRPGPSRPPRTPAMRRTRPTKLPTRPTPAVPPTRPPRSAAAAATPPSTSATGRRPSPVRRTISAPRSRCRPTWPCPRCRARKVTGRRPTPRSGSFRSRPAAPAAPAAASQGGNGYGGFPQGGPAPVFGQPQGNPVLTPAGLVGGVPMHLPVSSFGSPGGPQSQIETALSLPRPDPAALWMAQQEKQKGERRNTGVLIAVVALTAICVLGIGALIYFKLRARAQRCRPTRSPPSSPGPRLRPPPPPTASARRGHRRGHRGSHRARRRRPSRGQRRRAGGRCGGGHRAGERGQQARRGGKEEPGFLTIVCNPYCDEVFDQGKSLGPSPVVHLSVPPGSHRITLKKGKDSKVVSVVVVSGQVSAQRISMK